MKLLFFQFFLFFTPVMAIAQNTQNTIWTTALNYEEESDWGKVDYLGSNDGTFFLLHTNWEGSKGQPTNYYAYVEGYSKDNLEQHFRSSLNVPTRGNKSYRFVEGIPSNAGIHLLYSYFDKAEKVSVLSSVLVSNSGELVGNENRIATMPGRNRNFSPQYHAQWDPVSKGTSIITSRLIQDAMSGAYVYDKTARFIRLSPKLQIEHDREVELASKRFAGFEFRTVTASGDVITLVQEKSGKRYIAIVDMMTGTVSRQIDLFRMRAKKLDFIDNDVKFIDYVGTYADSKGRNHIVHSLHEEIDGAYHVVGYHSYVVAQNGELEKHMLLKVKNYSAAGSSSSSSKPSLKLFRERAVSVDKDDNLIIMGEVVDEGKVGDVIVLKFNLLSDDVEQYSCSRYIRMSDKNRWRYNSIAFAAGGKIHLYGRIGKEHAALPCDKPAEIKTSHSDSKNMTIFHQSFNSVGLSSRTEIGLHEEFDDYKRPVDAFYDPDGFHVIVVFSNDMYFWGLNP